MGLSRFLHFLPSSCFLAFHEHLPVLNIWRLYVGLVLFNWVLFALTLFGLAVIFDPLGSTRFNEHESSLDTLRHRKLARLWLRRLQWTFCWMRRDKHGDDAFFHLASKHKIIIIIIIIIIITRSKYENLFGKLEGSLHFGILTVEERIILKLVL
jgi:hypothetical protein